MTAPNDAGEYGRLWAHDYDRLFENREDVSAVVAMLSGLLPGRRLLELGVGTGRLAVPLAAAGFTVTGVDASPEMVDRLRGRPGADAVEVVLADFTDLALGRRFDVVLVAFSTLFLLPDQAAQLACLRGARRHLTDDGLLVVEAFVPDPTRWSGGRHVSVGALDDTSAVLKLGTHDPVAQVIRTQDVVLDASGVSLRPNRLRYVWPSELDALAIAAGLRKVARTADWAGRPFDAASTSHVSVYGVADAAPAG
ncbi:bifunctional 2-polyprenyl-6-hydroxyphenol methylase/3-demethylubiquinol 3-O-methyltransferase UbiG [Kineosporia sp. A_224]|uniref:class I SAM-dependent methyltransferase n=1 Tax=Kineosporia sp. A_224 TaxID=1962180 RepID=UPI000B4C044D|nr:class I SAM-dependent methyltransferase [Kineosporia sp. A_224]